MGRENRPKVGIISTGDELIAPGEKIELGKVYDSNAMVITHAVEELGWNRCVLVSFRITNRNWRKSSAKQWVQILLFCLEGHQKGEGI
ncbi:MAG: hypothetical protein Ct9H300mP28_04960 [Pseudomonadota bacterium]|nr:MAG: hypothetical protein Ct9H300mP28_04960 [Pseudomonadota bacterium]